MDWNELHSLTWPGYARKNGGKGIRNRVLVIYTVKCAEFVAQQIVAKSGSTNVELLGFDGCTDNQYAVNLLISFIRHPNVGAVLAVGLGCELPRKRASPQAGCSSRTRAAPSLPSARAWSGCRAHSKSWKTPPSWRCP